MMTTEEADQALAHVHPEARLAAARELRKLRIDTKSELSDTYGVDPQEAERMVDALFFLAATDDGSR